MHITILAVGSRGDVQPYIALGKGLQQAGYEVRLGAPRNFEALITQHNLDFAAIAPDSQQLMTSPAGRALVTSGQNSIKFAFKLGQMISVYAQPSLLAAWQACQNTDVIIFNHFGWMGYHIAEKLNIPACAAWIYPLTRTQDFPPIGTPGWLRLGQPLNRFTFIFYEQLLQYIFNQTFKEWRQMLELPPLPLTGFFEHFYRHQISVLYAYSPHVSNKPADWPERFVVTGYWFLDRPTHWQAPVALVDFLASGPPPVYIGFGSMSGDRPRELSDMAIDALKATGQRGILAKGWGGLETHIVNQSLTDDIFVIDSTSHDWLFPKMAAVVHHGGAGTTAAGLRAGVPSILIPFSGDQPFWGQRVAALGVGPTAIPYKKLSANHLATAIRMATTDASMQRRAAALGQQIRAEDGIACAIEALQRFL